MTPSRSGLIRDISLAVISNGIGLAISIVSILLLPKWMGVEDFSYFQLYVFYASFVGLFQFGLNDGIYLRLGGSRFEALDFRSLNSQLRILFSSQVIIGAGVSFAALLYVAEPLRREVWMGMAASIVVLGIRAMFLFVLQATGRISEYALAMNIGSVSFLLLILSALLSGQTTSLIAIACDILSKVLSLIYLSYTCRRFVWTGGVGPREAWPMVLVDVSAGIHLTLANLASLGIVGSVRFAIERAWGVNVFGSISLVLNVANLMILFVSAAGVALFPAIKRVAQERLALVYMEMRVVVVVISVILLLLYLPAKQILLAWLPNYSDSAMFLALLFPLFMFDARNMVLSMTFMKACRLERYVLIVNGFAVVLSMLLAFSFTVLVKDMRAAVLTILIVVVFRSILAEVVLAKRLGLHLLMDHLVETGFVVVFVSLAWYSSTLWVLLGHSLAVLLFLCWRGRQAFDVVRGRIGGVVGNA